MGSSSLGRSLIRLSLTFALFSLNGLAQPDPSQSAIQEPSQQVPGSVSGTVTDSTGAVIAGARVTLTPDDEKCPPQETRSDEAGGFSFSNVAPGSFEIRVMADSFAEQTFSGTLSSGEVYTAPPIT